MNDNICLFYNSGLGYKFIVSYKGKNVLLVPAFATSAAYL